MGKRHEKAKDKDKVSGQDDESVTLEGSVHLMAV